VLLAAGSGSVNRARATDDIPRGLEFLLSRNRLNVAISRARCLAYLVCSPRLLGTSKRRAVRYAVAPGHRGRAHADRQTAKARGVTQGRARQADAPYSGGKLCDLMPGWDKFDKI
jgi:hypothetical protein